MSSLTTLARPYAKAAFELALADQNLSGWDEQLTLASELASAESMANLLDNPLVQSGQVVKIMAESAGDAFTDRFRSFLSVLGANERLTLLPQITLLYRQLREKEEKRLSVRVVSAIPLDEDQAGRMRAALARRFDCEIELKNDIDAGVIGGAVVYAGDQVIDGSLRGRLQKLSNNLAN
jgi:F-type H+-transporting ATPase subunit delta